MENLEIAQTFEEVADLLEIQDENPFRIRAYRNAARVIRDCGAPLAQLCRENGGKKLLKMPGIGKDLCQKIQMLTASGQLPMLEELRGKVPAGLRELMRLPGLGPKRAVLLHKKLKITSLDLLRQAAENRRIRKLKGFGEKIEAHILQALQGLERSAKRWLFSEAKVYADAIVRHLKQSMGLRQVEVAGSYRRRQETIGDLDILVCCDTPVSIMERFGSYEAVAEVLARGQTRMAVRLRSGLQIDLRIVPAACFGAALQYFTGSKAHSIQLRRRAQERELKINEYGIFRGEKCLGGQSEEEVYASVGLPWIPPELREGRREIEWAEQRRLPHLLELRQIRGDLHMHTDLTDGRASLEEMVEAAQRRGYEYIAITDHSKRVSMALGLDARRLRQQWRRIDKLAAAPLRVLKGIEVDILEDARLDLPDEVLAEADWVTASIHYGQTQPRQQIMERLLCAIRNPNVDCIGHPTGRIIGKRQAYDLDLPALIAAAAEHNCALELNCQPDRLDLDDLGLAAAKSAAAPIVLSSDAHAVEELGFLEFGVNQARRGGLERADVLNTKSLRELEKFLEQ